MKVSILAFIAAFFLLYSCNNTQPVVKSYKKTKFGYEYMMHVDKDGALPQVGDIVYYHVQHRNGDVVTFSSRRVSQNPNKMMMPDYANGAVNPTGLLDLLKLMSPGDSATVRLDLNKLPMRPRGYESANYMNYDVKMVRIEKGKDQFIHKVEQQVKGMDTEVTPIQVGTETGVVNENPIVSEEQKLEMWDRTVHEQMKTLMRMVCDEYRSGTLENKLFKTTSGVKIMHVQQGDGRPVKSDAVVSLKYIGTTLEGKEFDHKFQKDKYYSFPLGKGVVIPGIEEGIKNMSVGGKSIVFIPPNLAFGQEGREGVQPNSEVAYLISLYETR